MPEIREACSGNQTDITGAQNGNLHDIPHGLTTPGLPGERANERDAAQNAVIEGIENARTDGPAQAQLLAREPLVEIADGRGQPFPREIRAAPAEEIAGARDIRLASLRIIDRKRQAQDARAPADHVEHHFSQFKHGYLMRVTEIDRLHGRRRRVHQRVETGL